MLPLEFLAGSDYSRRIKNTLQGRAPCLVERSWLSNLYPAYFSASQDRSEHEVDRMKSSLILCYGHVAAQAPRELLLARVESDILRSMFQCFNTKVGVVAVCVGQLYNARVLMYFTLCCLGSGNKGRDQGIVYSNCV